MMPIIISTLKESQTQTQHSDMMLGVCKPADLWPLTFRYTEGWMRTLTPVSMTDVLTGEQWGCREPEIVSRTV